MVQAWDFSFIAEIHDESKAGKLSKTEYSQAGANLSLPILFIVNFQLF